MTPPPAVPSLPPASGDTKLGIALRLAFFAGTVFVAAYFIIPILYGFFGLQVGGTIGLAATGLAANLLTMKIFDRRPFVDIGLKLGGASGIHLVLGILLGGGAAGLLLLAPLLAGTGHLIPNPHSSFQWTSVAFYLTTIAFAAAGEEMIFRGYALQFLIDKIGAYAAVLPVGVIFGLTHASNPNASGLAILNTALWGILLGYAFLRSHDLWLPIGMHFGWNAVLPLFGVNLSGLTIEITRFTYQWDLSPVWSGGAYGPEGGLLTTIFVVVLFFVLYRVPIHPQFAAIAATLNEPEF